MDLHIQNTRDKIMFDFTLKCLILLLYCNILKLHSLTNVENLCGIKGYYFNKVRVCHTKDNLLQIENWSFSPSSLLETLPSKQEREGYIGVVRGVSFSTVRPTELKKDVQLVAISPGVLANILDLDPNKARMSSEFLNFVTGNKVLPSSIPIAHRYGGHQVGFELFFSL